MKLKSFCEKKNKYNRKPSLLKTPDRYKSKYLFSIFQYGQKNEKQKQNKQENYRK